MSTAIDKLYQTPKAELLETKPLGFFTKHFRGEYPLGRSFWLHGVVAYTPIVLTNAFILGIQQSAPQDAVIPSLIMAPITYLFLLWWAMGTYESAKRHGNKLQSSLAKLVSIGYVGYQFGMLLSAVSTLF